MSAICSITSPVGILQVIAVGERLSRVEVLPVTSLTSQSEDSGQYLAQTIVEAFNRYFQDPAYRFEFELDLQGTDFQKRVWQALVEIPAGEVRTYGELARQLNSSPRAVGNACRANPVAIIVPCHRVVSQSGMGGYAGKTEGQQLAIKTWLLSHEGAEIAA